jgi:thiosulfate/3-mercaptopyruvate sulfurtransferase
MSMKCPPLVTAGWLAARLPTVKVVDASWYLPAMGRDARGEYAARRIPGARFFDLDDTDDTSGLPHMLPSADYFARCMSSLGVTSGDHVICYDGKGIFSAPRLWWMLRAFGHAEASVLDGGLPAWLDEGHPVDENEPPPPLDGKPDFAAMLQQGAVVSLDQVRANLRAPPESKFLVVDARPKARFEGAAAECVPVPAPCLPSLELGAARPCPHEFAHARARSGRVPTAVRVTFPARAACRSVICWAKTAKCCHRKASRPPSARLASTLMASCSRLAGLE